MIRGIVAKKSQYTIGRKDNIQMTAYDIYVMVRENLGVGAIGLIIIMSLVQFSKIEINPWSWIGNIFNKELRGKIDTQGEQIDALAEQITNVQTEVNENAAMSSRYRILRFDDEIRHGQLHTKEHYDQIMVDIDIYEAFCKRNPNFRNNLAHKAISNIKRMYDVHNDDNSFL